MTRATGGGSRGRATPKERLGLPFGAGVLPGLSRVELQYRGTREELGLSGLQALSCFCRNRNPLAVSLKGALTAPRGAEARGSGRRPLPEIFFPRLPPSPPPLPSPPPGGGSGATEEDERGKGKGGGTPPAGVEEEVGGGVEPSLPPVILPPLRRRSSRPQPFHAGAVGGRREPRPGLLHWTQGADLNPLPNPAGRTMPYESAPPLAIIVGAITAMGGIQALGNWMIYGKPKVS